MNIYVSNLRYNATEQEIQSLFETFGEVTSVSLIKDRDTGQSRGFAFVEMPDDDQAQKAILDLNGKEYFGRNLTVNQARPRENRPDRGSGGGYPRNQGDKRGGRGW